MTDGSAQFEKKLSPAEEREILRVKITESPGGAKEILKEHLAQKPEAVLDSSSMLTLQEKEEIKRTLQDPFYKERNEQLGALLGMVEEKGILPVASVVKDLDPALEDAFHDVLIQYLRSIKNV